MASTPSFSISPGRTSGPTDLFLPIAASRFLIILVLMVKGSLSELVVFAGRFARSRIQKCNRN